MTQSVDEKKNMNMIDNRTINEWKIVYYVRILTFHLQHQYWILPLITGLMLIGSLSIWYVKKLCEIQTL